MSAPLAAVAAAVLWGWAGAAAAPAEMPEAAALRDEGAAGFAVSGGPRYAGSDERRARLLPSLSYRWANGWFASLEQGVGINLSGRRDRQYGLRLTADFGRQENDSAALRGLGDVHARPELGVFFEQRSAAGWSLRAALRHGSGNDRNGTLLELGGGYALGPDVALGVGATLANAAYLQQYFGVDAAQAAASAYGLYTPQAGLRDVRAGATLTHPLAPRWGLNASLWAVRLGSEAAASPLVRERNNLLGTLGLAYRF